MKKSFYISLALISFLIIGLLAKQFINPETTQYQFKPTSYSAFVPKSNDLPFKTYIQVNKTRINNALKPLFKNNQKPYKHNPSLEQLVEDIAPFEITPILEKVTEKTKGHRVGFLFFHGLGNTSYDFKPMAKELHKHYPQSLMRATLLSGHGTVIADTIDTHYEEWKKITQYAISSMNNQVDELFLVGLSTGGSLILDYIQSNPKKTSSTPKIKGILLFAPGIETSSSLSFLTTYIKSIQTYHEIAPDLNPLKYESWTHNLTSQLVQLLKASSNQELNKIPTFMVTNSDDDTINYKKNIDYFCNQSQNPLNTLLFFQSSETNIQHCKGTIVFDLNSDPTLKKHYRLVSFSHVFSIFPPTDPIFGFDKGYHSCYHYFLSNEKRSFNICTNTNEKTVYGSWLLLNKPKVLNGKLLRRATFNPYYDQMMDSIEQFISSAINET